ncbi:MAG: DUF5916 domain-containing protein [Bacteroidota bacterium]|nr:DUF5916 domain-containing protein [Bacteroidota bacterium]
MKYLVILIPLLFLINNLYAINLDSVTTRPIVEAVRVSNPIIVDGILSEHEWQRPGVSDFTQRDPKEGAKPTYKTEVWVAYDDAALYVAARMYDDNPDSIVSRIGRRDAELSADWFALGIDSYHDRRNAFFFGVYPSGSFIDGIFFNDSWDDKSWDGVWDVATKIDDKGWTAEFCIPYSQLRFQEQKEYIWGVNFVRGIERLKEEDHFIMVPKKESGFVSHFADLIGIRDIHPPTRIEVLPYVVGKNKITNQISKNNPFYDGSQTTGGIGADLKFGLGSNLTLNATINPDFGQVEVDPAIVNLTQFENYFDEKRPFFVEGANYFNFGYGGVNNNFGFNWGNPDYFYSRRIGRSPVGNVQHGGYTNTPDATTIIAAGKLTGKLSDGWSLGTLHTLTQREYAHIADRINGNRYADVVEPFASHNVVRSLYEFNDGKQAVGFIGTGVLRDLNQPYLVDQFNKRSYAFGFDGWTNLDPDREYVMSGWFSTTRIEGSTQRMVNVQESFLHYFQRPDVDNLSVDTTATHMSGYAGRVAINKQKGNVVFNTAFGLISPSFDANDLGFMFRTNVMNGHVVLGYRWYEPDGTFRRKGLNIATFRNYDFAGNKLNEGYFLFWNAQLMNYWSFNGSTSFNQPAVDVYSTRGGPIMKSNRTYHSYIEGSTDYRKEIVYELEIGAHRSESGGFEINLGPGIEWKPASNMNLRFSPQYTRNINMAQWVESDYVRKAVKFDSVGNPIEYAYKNPVNDPSMNETYGARYIFSQLDQKELSARIRLDWTFTPKLSLQLFLQPLISVGHYYNFKEFDRPRTFTFNKYGENSSTIIYNPEKDRYEVDTDGNGTNTFQILNPDFNYKSIRLNAVFRWEFLPGSTAYFVWTRSTIHEANPGNFDFGRDFSNLATAPDHEDVFLVKVAYWWAI